MAVEKVKLCVLASGGDAPGMNACIEAILDYASDKGAEVWVARNGFNGIIDEDLVQLSMARMTGISNRSGCVFKCGRAPRIMEKDGFWKLVNNFKKHAFTSLICLGGNGSSIGCGRLKSAGVPVIVIPATIDNDVPFTNHALGFSSACETSANLVDMLRATMETFNRDHVVQFMGRSCSALTTRVGLACFADIIDINENRHTPKQVADIFRANRANGKPSSYMVMQERVGGDQIAELERSIEFMREVRKEMGHDNIAFNSLGYLQRGAEPSCYDRFLATLYGRAAVDCTLGKKFGIGLAVTNGVVRNVELPVDKIPMV